MMTLTCRTKASPTYGWPRRWLVTAMMAVMIATPTVSPFSIEQSVSAAGTSLAGLHVVGNQLVNGTGEAVRLLGVNRSGTEYACIDGWGFHDGPADLTTVRAIAAWKATAIRVPLNETCWLGINGAPATYSGT